MKNVLLLQQSWTIYQRFETAATAYCWPSEEKTTSVLALRNEALEMFHTICNTDP